MKDEKKGLHKLEWSAALTILGVILLFSTAIGVTLIAPQFIDPSWKMPSSAYQVQMYEVSDPNVYVSTSNPIGWSLQYVYHLKNGFSLLAFQETEAIKIITHDKDLEKYITHLKDPELKLTSRPLLLRKLEDRKEGSLEVLELFDPKKEEVFAITETDGVVEFWAEDHFKILDKVPPYETKNGTLYIHNPKEYKIRQLTHFGKKYWLYNENGSEVKDTQELKETLRFISRKELISMGEKIFRIEGCWYCHTDQTRTLISDTVLNGSADYPAPPSSANEYIFQKVTFPGTRRIGPDLSRVGIKRPNRDWHLSHFWSPTSESKGSIMPSFKHFFDKDPAGGPKNPFGIPNYQFEAIFHYLMTKGTRITPPTQAWWLGKDPIQTIDIIEGRGK